MAVHSLLDNHHIRAQSHCSQRVRNNCTMAKLEDHVDCTVGIYGFSRYRGSVGGNCCGFDVSCGSMLVLHTFAAGLVRI